MATPQSLLQSKKTASGTVFSGKGFLGSMLIGTDGTNDPTITIYDNTSASGTEIVPSTTYDASALGLNGMECSFLKKCATGCYVEITCAGTVEVTIGYMTQG